MSLELIGSELYEVPNVTDFRSPVPLARPREFEIEDAIAKAMDAFWVHGYDGASLPVLLDAMGISRGSFYKAFGSKKALFLRVLDHYDAMVIRPGVAALRNGDRPGGERLARVVDGAVGAVRAGDRRGCLMCNTAAGAAYGDEDIAAVVNDQSRRLAKAMAVALADTPRGQGLDDGTLRAEGEALAQSYMGLRVAVRAGRDVRRLEDASMSHLDSFTGARSG